MENLGQALCTAGTPSSQPSWVSECDGSLAAGGCQKAKDRAGILSFQEKSGIQVLK